MPALPENLENGAASALEPLEATAELINRGISDTISRLVKRINIPYNSTSPPGLIEANTVDPWNKSGKYALAVVYFCMIFVVSASLMRSYHFFTDKTRTALYQEEVLSSSITTSPDTDYELSVLNTDKTTAKFFPRHGPLPQPAPVESLLSSFSPFNVVVALMRWIFYRPVRQINLRKGWRPVVFPSLAAVCVIAAALILVILYTFVPQPLYWGSIRYGSPPVAIRSGMMAVALMPWIIALSMKANVVSLLTGIGHERLNVLHRWGAYLMLFLSLVHTVPFYITPVWDDGGMQSYKALLKGQNFYPYGTGIASLVPLIFLCVHSIPHLRAWMYELFVIVHVPVSILFFAMLFWHCNNYLTSWHYLYTSLAIWLTSYAVRVLFYLNWTNPFKVSWLIGDEAAVTILPENAIKVTIPTQRKWRPGQYVYLRMPGISIFENHPFTIASLCSKDFPSTYGPDYKDMVLVFRPFGGFTQKVLRSAIQEGPWQTYRAFVDGPYGGMQRRLEAFDDVILIAGGSGVTAVVSHLLDLIKRMRDGKAITKSVKVIWALKRPETMEWFKEELRICREFAPPDTVQCRFYITAAKRMARTGQIVSATSPGRPVSAFFHDKVDAAFNDIADKRISGVSMFKRQSALIQDEAQGDVEREKELRRENEDAISALPQAHLRPLDGGDSSNDSSSSSNNNNNTTGTLPSTASPDSTTSTATLEAPQPTRSLFEKRRSRNLSIDISHAMATNPSAFSPTYAPSQNNPAAFDFGFPSTPTEFQKNLMRFAFLPAAVKSAAHGRGSWSTEYGRPDLPFMLREWSREWGRRTCVFVCGPPGLRIDVAETVARLQGKVWRDGAVAEVFLHTENYAI